MIDEVGLEGSGTLGIAPYWASSPPIDSSIPFSIYPDSALSGSFPTLRGSQRVLKGSMFKIDLSTARKIDEIQVGRNLSPFSLASHQGGEKGVVSAATRALQETSIRANHEPAVKEHKHTKSGFGHSFCKTTSKIGLFVAKYKWEILGGAALCATGVGVAAALGYSLTVSACGVTVATMGVGGGAGTGAGIGAGAGAGLGALLDLKDKSIPKIPNVPSPSSSVEIAIANLPITSPLPKIDLPSTPNELLVTTNGIWAHDQFYSTTELMQGSLLVEEPAKASSSSPNYYGDATSLLDSQNPFLPSLPDYLADAAKLPENPFSPPTVGNLSEPPRIGPDPWSNQWADFDSPSKYDSDSRNPFARQPEFKSRTFILPGKEPGGLHIGWINGVANSFDDSHNNGSYLQKLTGGYAVCGIYNCTHTVLVDSLEAGFLNYQGCSPNTSRLLQNDWRDFHEANPHRPNAKILWICHSQGAIHVKNALEALPLEIRDRVIVVAIAPAAVVPKHLCFKSFNYASEKDIIYTFETPAAGIGSLSTHEAILSVLKTMKNREELIILEAHPGAENIDHAFQSPTYKEVLKNALEDYEAHKGEYLPEEKQK